ncbi:MAG: N-acyl homoserine lactonase family protein [Hespellia sp.]|nr:N-acyl homoserine lactonase family protein [Hespellia sp.]
MTEYTIKPIVTGFCKTNKSTYIYHPSVHKFYDTEGFEMLPVTVFLVEGNGKKILIDTGMCQTEIADKYHHPGDTQPEGYAIYEKLEAMGYKCGEITDIIFTHLHWDHIYHMKKFPNAKRYVQRSEYEFATNPIPLYFKSYEEPRLGLTPQFDGLDFVLLDGECEVMDGISVYLTPGHSIGHQNIVINTKEGKYHCCGDLIFTYDNLLPVPEMNYDITPPGRFQDIVSEWNSIIDMKKRAGSKEMILPTHDPLMIELEKEGKVFGA